MDTLNYAIIHSLDREDGSSPFSIRYRERTLDTGNKYVVALTQQLVSLVGKDGSVVSYGKLRDDRREGSSPTRAARPRPGATPTPPNSRTAWPSR